MNYFTNHSPVVYFLFQLNPVICCLMITLLVGMLGIGTTYVVRNYTSLSGNKANNEIVGLSFAVIGGFYGLLMGFVMLFVWETLRSAQDNSNREGSNAYVLYRDIKYFPDKSKIRDLMDSYLKYVDTVVHVEYPLMEKMEPIISVNRKGFNDVFLRLEQMDKKDPSVQEMFSTLNDLANFRGLRRDDAEAKIPSEIWVPLLVGGQLLLVLATMLHVQNKKMHFLVNGLIGVFIGLVIYIIIIIDHPFSGSLRIKPIEYIKIGQDIRHFH